MSEWKETEIYPVVPNSWESSKLGDLGSFKNGLNFNKSAFGKGIPIVNVKQLHGGRHISTIDLEELKETAVSKPEEYSLKKNDILFARSSVKLEGTGQVAMVGDQLSSTTCFSGFIIRYRLESFETINPVFLNYLLRSSAYREFFISIATGTSIFNLSQAILSKVEIFYPNVNEQIAIAEVLSSLDDKIDLLHRQNQTLEQMAETLFRQWFVEEANEGWEESTINDFDVLVTDYVANGSFASLKENVTLITDREEYALFIRNTDLKSGFANKVYVDEHAYSFLSKTKLFGGEVIISSVGDVGSVFRCPKFDIPMTLGNNIIMLNSDYNLFFYLLFQSKYGQDMIYGITSGSVQQKFNKTAFRGLKITYPSLEYIAEFESFVKPYFDKIDFNQTQIRTLTALRDTLLPKLMSGEVRVQTN